MFDKLDAFTFNNLHGYFMQKCGSAPLHWLRWCYNIIATKLGLVKYEGLEPFNGLTSEVIEKAMMFKSSLCVYNSPTLGLGLYYYIPNSTYDMYMKPISVNIQTLNGIKTDTNVPYADIVPLRDNLLDIPPFIVLENYMDIIIHLEKKMNDVITINTMPVAFEGEPSQINTFKQLFKKAQVGEPFVILDKKQNLSPQAKSFDISSPLKPMDLYDLMIKYVKMCYNDMGIDSVDEKAERMVVNELDAQNDYTAKKHQEQEMLRVDAWEEVNRRWGTNVKVIYHDADLTTVDVEDPMKEKQQDE